MYDTFPRYPNLTREIAFKKIIMSKPGAKEAKKCYFAHMSWNIPRLCTFRDNGEKKLLYRVV